MVMRVGGLATGMDIEAMVNKLMDAERIPLQKLEQNRTLLEWKRDAYRDINKNLLELNELLRDMKFSNTYQTKTVTSSQENAITATGSTSALNGTYNIEVTELATSAMQVGELKPGMTLDTKIQDVVGDTITFTTYDEDGAPQLHEIEVGEEDTLKDVIKKINDHESPVRAFYDEKSGKFIMETTRTGEYNSNGNEIEFAADSKFFTEVLSMGAETGGKDATFTYNGGPEFTSKDNSYTLNGVTFQFHNTTNGAATLTVANDIESSFDAIVKFVDTYNKLVDALNGTQTEERFRDFKPLTDEQKKEMSEDEIKKWEEKAKSGLLKGDSILTSSATNMRTALYTSVDVGGEFSSILDIGITTTSNWMDGGKLTIDEDKLRQALQDNPDDVQKLFSNVGGDGKGDGGLVYQLETAVKGTMDRIDKQAGKTTHTLDNYALGKQMKDLNSRISQFEARMSKLETRYWNQFTQMEKAIQRLNDQSAQLFSQFG